MPPIATQGDQKRTCSIQLALTSHFEIQQLYSQTLSDELNDPLPEAQELVISLEASDFREG